MYKKIEKQDKKHKKLSRSIRARALTTLTAEIASNWFASLRKNCIKCSQTINILKAVDNIARKMVGNCECTLVPTDFSKTCSGNEIIWLYGPALNGMSVLQESF